MEWITFQGKEISTETADHQHLSNCIWFIEIFWPYSPSSQMTRDELLRAIKDRFNGQILPYRPHIDFTEEIETLKQRGYLGNSFSNGVSLITYRGVVIGEVRQFPDFKVPRDEQL